MTEHYFNDGNKRTGYVITLIFLLNNGYVTQIDDAQYMENVTFFKHISDTKRKFTKFAGDDAAFHESNILELYNFLKSKCIYAGKDELKRALDDNSKKEMKN